MSFASPEGLKNRKNRAFETTMASRLLGLNLLICVTQKKQFNHGGHGVTRRKKKKKTGIVTKTP
jgi:hypothetical protein